MKIETYLKIKDSIIIASIIEEKDARTFIVSFFLYIKMV